MIDSIPPTLPANRAVPSAVTADRAVVDSDQPQPAAGTSSQRLFGPAPEPLNRRGRRHIAGEIRRSERQIFRSLKRVRHSDR